MGAVGTALALEVVTLGASFCPVGFSLYHSFCCVNTVQMEVPLGAKLGRGRGRFRENPGCERLRSYCGPGMAETCLHFSPHPRQT